MSTLKVTAVQIKEILVHPNADRLSIATFENLDWQCVVGKDQHKKGDVVIYIPIDSILPENIEAALFGPDSKIKLNNHRVRTIKIRGAISQGMVATWDQLRLPEPPVVGDDVTEVLGIKKFEPAEQITTKGGRQRTRKETNPNFFKYTDIENMKNYPQVFTEGEEVVISEKIHGTNARFGWVPAVADTWWKKVKKFFGRLPEYDFVYGSRNVQLQNGNPLNGDPAYENVYSKAVKKYDLRNRIPKGWVIYGEIYGEGIQNNYTYGKTRGDFGLVLFDIMVDGKYFDYRQFDMGVALINPIGLHWTDPFYLQIAPVLYEGPFDMEYAKSLTKGDSVLCPTQKVREGVVIRPVKEEICHMGRKILKLISEDYLLKEQTEFH